MADFGNITGVVKKFTEPLNADLSPKTFVLWAKETIAAGDEVTLMRYDFVTSSWVPLSSEESVYKVDAATDINQPFVGVLDVDGITLVNGNRVLLFGQTDPIENGVYVSDGAGALSRPPRFSTSVLGDHLIIALGGTKNKFGEWMPTNTSNVDGFIVDTDPIEYVQTHVNDTISGSTVANLGYTAAPTHGKVTNAGGTDSVITLATTVNAGLQSPADKNAIDKTVQLSGRPIGSPDLGTFTGVTITDNATIKLALQQLETKAEAGVDASKYTQTFLVGDFVTEDIVILQTTHLKGLYPTIQIIDDSTNEIVSLDSSPIDIVVVASGTGDVTITVLAGLEFDGLVVIS